MVDLHVVMGSRSDLDIVESSDLETILDKVVERHEWSAHICSAHRNPQVLLRFAQESLSDGGKVYIAVAGMASALPGALAGATRMVPPVIAVPLDEHGIDSCLYMPPGVPLATLGVGKVGLRNAAMFACQILGVGNIAYKNRLVDYVNNNTPSAEFGVIRREGNR